MTSNDLLPFGFDFFLEQLTKPREVLMLTNLLKDMVKDTDEHQIIRAVLAKYAGRDAELQCPPGCHSLSPPTCSPTQRLLNLTFFFIFMDIDPVDH